jgi:hypothetical protein
MVKTLSVVYFPIAQAVWVQFSSVSLSFVYSKMKICRVLPVRPLMSKLTNNSDHLTMLLLAL